jgi:hypothetical protein
LSVLLDEAYALGSDRDAEEGPAVIRLFDWEVP